MVDRRERVHDDAPLVQFGPDLGEGDVRLRLDQRPHHIGVRFENRTAVAPNAYRRGAPQSHAPAASA